MEDILRLEELKHLKESLGNNFAKIRYHTLSDDKPSRVHNIKNTVIHEMQHYNVTDYMCPVNDCLIGVASLDWSGSKTLKASYLYLLLKTMENINTENVMVMLEMSKRNAQRYVKAIRIALPHLEKILLDDEEGLDIIEEVGDNQFNDLGDY